MKRILVVIMTALLATMLAACSTPAAMQEPAASTAEETLQAEPQEQPAEPNAAREAVTVPDGYEMIYNSDIISTFSLIAPEEEVEWKAEYYVELTEQQAIDSVTELLSEASADFREKGAGAYKMTVDHRPVEDPATEQMPIWHITFDDIDGHGIRRDTMNAEIDMRGRVYLISIANTGASPDDNLPAPEELISDSKAIEIARQTLSENDTTLDPEIYGEPIVQKREWKGKIYCDVTFQPREGAEPTDDGALLHYHLYTVQLDAETGEMLMMEQCM